MTGAAVKPFQLVAGHVALDLVNTLDSRFSESGPEDLLESYDDVLRFVNQAELLTDLQTRRLKRMEVAEAERGRVLKQVRQMREALAAVTYAMLDGQKASVQDLAILEDYFQQTSTHRQLAAKGTRVFWRWRAVDEEAAAPLWLLAQETADLLLSERGALLRRCAIDTCQWLFLDTSKNHTRRWCDMKTCGNRMKARRFQQRSARG